MMLKNIMPIICVTIAPFLDAASTHKNIDDFGSMKESSITPVQGFTYFPGEQRYYAVDGNFHNTKEAHCSHMGRVISGPSQTIVDAIRMQLGGDSRFNDLTLETAVTNILAKDSNLAEQAQSVRVTTGPLERLCHIILPAELHYLIKDLPACDHQDEHCAEHQSAVWKIIKACVNKAPTKHYGYFLGLVVERHDEYMVRR